MAHAYVEGMNRNHKREKVMNRKHDTIETAGMVVVWGFSALVLVALLVGYVAILINALK